MADTQNNYLHRLFLGVEFREMATYILAKSGIVPLTRQSPMYLVEHGHED